MLAALRCPECTAPVRELARCTYCGAALAIAASASGRTVEHYSVVLRVGPSNVERVAMLLELHLGAGAASVRERLARPPTELTVGEDEVRAHQIARDAKEAGAQAEITSRTVTVPLRTVTLESAGEKPLAVVVALRAEIELSVAEAKQVVASVPSVVAVGIEDAEAQAFVRALEAAGAKATAR